jgi:hypothetical protein
MDLPVDFGLQAARMGCPSTALMHYVPEYFGDGAATIKPGG